MKPAIIFVASAAIALLACQKDSAQKMAKTPLGRAFRVDSLPSSCPLLQNDGKGHPVLSYVRMLNDSVSVVAYAVSWDQGKTFDNSVEIASSMKVKPHGENPPRMVFNPDGGIIAAWGADNASPAKKYGGLVYYAQSRDGGKTFSEAKRLVADSASIDQRYFDMAVLPNGEVGIIWLDSRQSGRGVGSTLYFAATRGPDGFQDERPIGETTCQCCRTELFVDSKGRIHAAYRDIINDTLRDMVHTVSADTGRSFSVPRRISPDNWAIDGCPHTGPAMAENRNGLHFAWYTMGGGSGVFYGRSGDYGKTFTLRESVSEAPSAKHPQIAAFGNGNIAIVWDEAMEDGKGENRIGLQIRDPEGKPTRKELLSPAGVNSEFPAVMAIGGDILMVAYTQTEGNKKNVYYRLAGGKYLFPEDQRRFI